MARKLTKKGLAEIGENLRLDKLPNRHAMAVTLLQEAFTAAIATKDLAMMVKIAEILSPETTIYKRALLRAEARLEAKSSDASKKSDSFSQMSADLQEHLRKSSGAEE